jgi:hypothetical protein
MKNRNPPAYSSALPPFWGFMISHLQVISSSFLLEMPYPFHWSMVVPPFNEILFFVVYRPSLDVRGAPLDFHWNQYYLILESNPKNIIIHFYVYF